MFAPGTVIGGLRIDGLLGRGAMGEVYCGEQLALRRPVAIKRIADHLAADTSAIQRFEREARCVAMVNDRHVVTVHDLARHRDASGAEHLLLVMELVENGRSLRGFIADGHSLHWRDACSIMAQVCDGLAAAHACGIVHRDLKPENILLAADGTAKIADFGLARSVDSTALTTEGNAIGTPRYMSPEACRGDPLGPAADLYSLGATWYHLLAGRPPFTGETALALLRAHCDLPPPPLGAVASEVPAPILDLVMACLAKDPARRPTAQHLASTLRTLVAQGLHFPERVGDLLRQAGVPTTSDTLITEIAADAPTLRPGAPPPSADAPILPTAAPAAVPVASSTPSRRRRPLLLAALAVALALACGLTLLLRHDPLTGAIRDVEELLASGDTGPALAAADALVALHPGRREVHDLIRRVVDREVEALVQQRRHDEAVALVQQRSQARPWLPTDAWHCGIGLARASDLIARNRPDEADEVLRGLAQRFPGNRDLRQRHVDLLGAGSQAGPTLGAVLAAWNLAEGGTGPLPEDVGATLLAGLLRQEVHAEFAKQLRTLLVARHRAVTVAAAHHEIESDNLDHRRHAQLLLTEADALADREAIRYHVRTLVEMSSVYRDDQRQAMAWLRDRATRPDWAVALAAAGIAKIDDIRDFDQWSEHTDELIATLAATLAAPLRDALVRWAGSDGEAAAEHYRRRWNAWRLLQAAKIDAGVDAQRFHAGTLLAFDPTYSPSDSSGRSRHPVVQSLRCFG